MASEVERLIVALDANIEPYRRKLRQSQAETNTRLRGVEQRYGAATAKIGKQSDVMGSKMTRAFRGAATSATLIHGPLSGIGSRVTAISGSISRGNVAWAGFAVVLGGVTYTAYQALEAFQKFETQSLVLEQVLRATGTASGKTAEDLERLAQSIALNTLASTEGVRAAAAQLLTFRSISGEAFDRTLSLAQDLAAVGFGSIQQASVQLGKALEDPVQGLASLRRVGVSFSESQKQVIKSLLETGKTAAAQEKILDAIEKQVGGAGASAAGGLAGAYDTLSQATDNLLVKWGEQIAEAINLKASILGVADAFKALQDATTTTDPSQERLNEINEKVARLRALIPNSGRARVAMEQELRELLAERATLQIYLIGLQAKEEAAARKGVEAQKQLDRERAEGVRDVLREEEKKSGILKIQRRIIEQLGKAGVDAESAIGKEIVNTIHAIERADLALKNRLATQAQLAETQAQIDSLGRSDQEAAYRLALEGRLNEARAAGIELTKEDIALIEQQTAAITKAEAEREALFKAYEEVASQSKETLGQFIKDMKDGTSATEALGNALDGIANKLIDMATNDLVEIALGGITGRGGNPTSGGFGAAVGEILGLAGGGMVQGPGTGTSDSIPARLSDGEYVVNADATRKYQPLLEAINAGKVPGFAAGGPVNVPNVSIPAVATPSQPVSVTVAPVFNVENGTPEGVDKMQSEVTPRIRQIVQTEVVQLFERKSRFAKTGI